MASQPNDIRWPPGTVVDFDSIFERLLALKAQHFPEHTVQDPADPVIQILGLMSAMGQHAMGRVNYALLQFSPKTAQSRRALIILTKLLNRPLLPITPARGPFYARLKDAPVASETLADSGQRIQPTGVQDPIFSVDEENVVPASPSYTIAKWDATTETESSLTTPFTFVSMESGDAVVFSFERLAFTGVALTLTLPLADDTSVWAWEFRNDEVGYPNAVNNLGVQLRFRIDTFMLNVESLGDGAVISVTCKLNGVMESATAEWNGSNIIVTTSFLGQTDPSLSSNDYEITTEWRPLVGVIDGTSSFSESGDVTFNIESVFSSSVKWYQDELYRYRIRARLLDPGALTEPLALTFTLGDNPDNYWATGYLTQGYRQRVNVGSTDGSRFQFLPLQVTPIVEPVADPEIVIEVGTDTDWSVEPSFSNSDSLSKHAVVEEDVDDGWGVQFGDGALGMLPPNGEAVRLTIRTGSVQSGNLDAGSSIKAIGGVNKLDTWTIYRGTSGYLPPEASDRESALRFRSSILPQLALRAESAVTPDEIVQAMTGGAPYRATFETADGRKPFSRALFSLEGAGSRQYRVMVAGDESVNDGAVDPADIVEATTWLNGASVGLQMINGHGPMNTEAIVEEFIARELLPTITITIDNPGGVSEQVDQIVRQFFKPHARDSRTGEFRWEFGGRVPIPNLFSLLWDALPNRVFIDITVEDGSETHTVGSSIQLATFELPVLDSTYDPLVNIIIVEPG